MTTTTLTQHEHSALKTQLNGSWPVSWDHGQWVEREDTMVFLVKEQPRLLMPKEEFAPFAQKHQKAEARHR